VFDVIEFSVSVVPIVPLAGVFIAQPAIKIVAKNTLKVNLIISCKRDQTAMLIIKI
jgi:hypothetical protein